MLVPIEFPDDLVIAVPWVEIGHPRPECRWRMALVYRIEVPVDPGSIPFERQIFKAQQIVSVFDNGGRASCCGFGC